MFLIMGKCESIKVEREAINIKNNRSGLQALVKLTTTYVNCPLNFWAQSKVKK